MRTHQRTVLIISAFFPPTQNIAAVRAGKMIKYLPSFGWIPICITCDDRGTSKQGLREDLDSSNVYRLRASHFSEQVIYEQSRFLMRIFGTPSIKKSNIINKEDLNLSDILARIGNSLSLFFEDPQGWSSEAIKLGIQLCNSRSIDVILSSYSPWKTHYVAWKIHKKTAIPWVAEYRDPWTFNPYMEKIWPVDKIERLYESHMLKDSTAIIGVTPSLTRELSKKLKKPAFTVFNGFDEDEFKRGFEPKGSSIFTISYTGKIHLGKRDPTPLLTAIDDLISEKIISEEDIRIRFYGGNVEILRPFIEKSLEKCVELIGPVSYADSLKIQMNSTALLLLSWNDERDAQTLTGKIFEYFGAARPILALAYKKGEIARLIEDTRTGVTANSPNEIKEIIKTWFKEMKQIGQIKSYYNPDHALVCSYTRKAQCAKLAQILNAVSDNSNKETGISRPVDASEMNLDFRSR